MNEAEVKPRTKGRRWLQFSLRTFLLLVAGIAILVAVDSNRRLIRNQQRQAARHMAAHELTRIHGNEWNTDPINTVVVRDMYDGILKSVVEPNWNYSFLSTASGLASIPAAKSPQNDFERTALERIRQGEKEFWQTDRDGAARYALAIRGSKNCSRCHVPIRGRLPAAATAPKWNVLYGVAIIELPPE